jgi:hypothetical protein
MIDLIPIGEVWSFKKNNFINESSIINYVTPSFNVSANGNSALSPYLVIAAPGAVGKSAFARHLAKTKNAMIWNLANLRLGSNTFKGSIMEVIGIQDLSAFFSSIDRGDTTLVFDALDEAEVHSGWVGVQQFVEDVIKNTQSARPASVIFMTRRDTAGMIELALADLLPLGQTFSRVDIGFFSQEAALQFIFSEITAAKGAEFLRRHKSIIEEKARAAFSISVDVSEACPSSEADGWQSSAQKRFFGYAPVLQIISKVLSEADNISTLNFDNHRAAYTNIISDIMEKILDREQSKMIEALKKRFKNNEADCLGGGFYSRNDQLARLLSFVNNDSDNAFKPPHGMSANISAHLSEMLHSLLPQHPFLDGQKFSSPAFRDYVLAIGLTRSETRFDCELWIDTNHPLFTPIFANQYHLAASGEANSSDIEMLYESANSGGVFDQSNLLLYVSEADVNKIIIEIASDDSDPLGEHLEFSANKPGEISFYRRLCNASIIHSGAVVLGRRDQPFEIIDSNVVAEEIRVPASDLRVRTISKNSTYLESKKAVKSSTSLKINVHPPEVLKVNWPESNKFPWRDYAVDFRADDDIGDAQSILHVVARILSWFRKDRRNEYGRYRDLIVNIVVGKSENARYALGYLQHISALYQRGNLFFVNTDILDSHGVSWQKIRSGDIPPKALASMKQYLGANTKPPEF